MDFLIIFDKTKLSWVKLGIGHAFMNGRTLKITFTRPFTSFSDYKCDYSPLPVNFYSLYILQP